MKRLVDGVHRFQRDIFGDRRGLFARLANHQAPHTLFVTCADSRISPSLITQTEPGEVFILRNAGNIVPPHGVSSGEAATVEFAVSGLHIEDIVVCGHGDCGALKAALDPRLTEQMPEVRAWVRHAARTREILDDRYPDATGDDRLNIAAQENVLAQIENLCTHPAIAERLARGAVRIHGWVYKIATGEVFAYDPEQKQFLPLQAPYPVAPRHALSA
ncbi:MAG TPA: carbonic anhydrase [Polyangiaceae bacterium]|nr:carbonic anhydrase [Polyangiaceae bacterium]